MAFELYDKTLNYSPVLTWSQVFGVGDQILHGLHHFCHRQVLQDAFAHTDDFADLCQKESIGPVMLWHQSTR